MANMVFIRHAVLLVTVVSALLSARGDVGSGYVRRRLSEAEGRVMSIFSSTNSPDGTFQDRRVQIGENAQAVGVTDGGRNQSIAIGFNAEASGMTSIAIGSGGTNYDGTANAPKARGGNSIAIGYDTEAETQAVSIGQSAKSKRGASVAIGLRATNFGQHDIAIGTDAVVTNWFKMTTQVVTNGTEIVTNTVVTTNTYNYSIALGKDAVAAANFSVQIGAGTNTKGNTIKFQDRYLATENYVSDNYQPKGSYITEEVDPTVPEWAKAENPPVETDPTVPEWAKAENPPVETDPTVPEWAKAENPPVETDPTVPEWAKNQVKPAYTASEVGAATPQDVTNKFDEIGPVHANTDSVTDGRIEIGAGASAYKYSVVVGAGAKSDLTYGVAVGTGADAGGRCGVALGNNAVAGTDSVSVGHSASATNSMSVAVGYGSKARDEGSIAIGNNALTIDSGNEQPNIAIGKSAESRGNSQPSIALGVGAVARADSAVQIGTGTNADARTIQFLGKKLATEEFARPFKIVRAECTCGDISETMAEFFVSIDESAVREISVGDLVMLPFPLSSANNTTIYFSYIAEGAPSGTGRIFVTLGNSGYYGTVPVSLPPIWRVKSWNITSYEEGGETYKSFGFTLSFPYGDTTIEVSGSADPF